MQALGSYRGDTMLFLGLGTGLGTALVVNGHLVPLELGHFPFGKKTIEDHLGTRGLETLGRARWRRLVGEITQEFVAAFLVDDVVLGGGNVKKLGRLPKGCRAGANANAFLGGFRLWDRGQR
jgi:polyphosphate glucokinase